MPATADKLRRILTEERLGTVEAIASLTGMICLFIVNPSGDGPKVLIGALLAIAVVALTLELSLYGFGDDEAEERAPSKPKFARFRLSLLEIAIAAVLVWVCVTIADSVDPDYVLAASAAALGVLASAVCAVVDASDRGAR